MSKKNSKLALLTEELIKLIPDDYDSKKDLAEWLLKNPYSPYITLFKKEFSEKKEIKDVLKLKIENFRNFDNKILSANGLLAEFVESKELFSYYPNLKNINIKINISFFNRGIKDSKTTLTDDKISCIEVTADSNINAMSTLLYELQHAIQLEEKNRRKNKTLLNEENLNNFQTLEEATELIKEQKLFQNEILYKDVFVNAEYFYESKNKYKSKVVLLSPDEYLEAVKIKQPKHPLDFRKIKKLEELLKDGAKFEIPYIKYGSIDIDEENDKYTFKQEGYHRAIIAKDKKIDKIPVIISYRDNNETIPKFIKNKLNLQEFDKEKIYKKIFDENGVFELDNQLRNNIQILNHSFTTIKSFKQNVPKIIDSPIGKINVNLAYAFNHMLRNNSTKMNRTKYNGNFAKDLLNPLLVIKSTYNDKESYYFYNIYKDESHNLINTLHCLVKNDKDELIHKTFYKFEKGLGKIKRLIKEGEILHCHKLLTSQSIESERIHYSNADVMIQKKDNFVNQENRKYPTNIVFHGTNSDFDEFSLKYNRKGKGINLYGFGLYFSESKTTAKNYGMDLGTKVTINGEEYDSLNPHHYAINILKNNCNVYKNAMFELKRELKYALPESFQFQKEAYEILKKEKQNIYNYKRELHDNSVIYTARIPNKKLFLKEYASINSQTREIMNIIEKIDEETFPNKEALVLFKQNKLTGLELYDKINYVFDKDEIKTSEYLHSLGIKGFSIKNLTLDETTNHNYVVFSDNDIEIIQKETQENITIYNSKNIEEIPEDKMEIQKLLSIVPTGMDLTHVNSYLLYNGFSEHFLSGNRGRFINKIDSEYLEQTKKINYLGNFLDLNDEMEAREIPLFYLKGISDLANETIEYSESIKSINLIEFKDMLDDMEIKNFENANKQVDIQKEGSNKPKKEESEIIARIKVII